MSGAVFAILDRPALLARELEDRAPTLVHGALSRSNLGLTSRRVVILDWGLATRAPAAVDFAAYLIQMSSHVDAPKDVMLNDFRALHGVRHDERALRLALLGAVVQFGWAKAYDAVESTDRYRHARVAGELDWWVGEARRSLETWSPV